MSKALVIGGSSGIGAATVRALRERGDDVVLVDIDAQAGRSLRDEPGAGSGQFVELDVSTVDGARGAVDAALEIGDQRLDIVFVNAGRLDARPLDEWTPELWDRTMQLNLRTPFLVAQRAAPALARGGNGRIIVTSSTGAFRGHAGMFAYHASKAGQLGLVRALADELGPAGVTVNAICPGWIDTPFNDAYWSHQSDRPEAVARLESGIPLGRQGTPHDVVGTVLFFASPASAYITGQSIVVDGGYTAV